MPTDDYRLGDIVLTSKLPLRRDEPRRRRLLGLLHEAMSGMTWFDKLLYQAIYWYLIEQIAKQLKSGELRNPKIYEFNPDAVYDPKRHCKKTCDQSQRTKNQ
ncbi:MAG: hypothetical protein Q8M16_16640, partial [Pirellulaceae bacterium]|nr:hypothetical protein [Pirellulaceae bacterium]